MEALLIYWLKANVVLALFAAAYYTLLRQLTFFGLNRAYLLFAVLFAAVYPLLPMPALLPAVPLPLAVVSGEASHSGPAGATPAAGFNWWQLAGIVYLVGAAILLLRLLSQLLSLALLRRRARPAMVQGQAVRVVPGPGGPFSFGSTIYLTESALADTAGLGAALRHERAHVRQAHTLDVLLLQVASALAWANPAAWLLRRYALDNLEYLADRAALYRSDLAPRAYQYLLLRQQTGLVPAPALAFHFSFPTLKNRVLMLNQPLSSPGQLGRYVLAIPFVVLLALGYSGARAQTAPVKASNSLMKKSLFFVDGQASTSAALDELEPAAIKSVSVIKDRELVKRLGGAPSNTGVVVIITSANANSPAVEAFNKKYLPEHNYKEELAQVNAVVPRALAYITSHYPEARLSGQVTKLTETTTGAVKLKVQLVRGKRPFDVYFSPEGDFLSE